LHGHSGNYSDWISKVPQVKNYADEFDEMIVCPDGHVNSWYFDSEVDTTIKYETYISSEVPHYIDSAYKQFLIERQERFAG
jgi:S-formylglutathione hydrolase FrmB